MAISFLDVMGIATLKRSEVTETLDNQGQGALAPKEVYELGLEADHEDADVLVLSCTDMRSVEVLAQLEAAVGKPVISSNQAMMYQALELLGLRNCINGFGSLLERRQ